MSDQRWPGSPDVEILVAEDSLTQALSLQYLLEQEGYGVTVCENGRKALEAARKRKPTLVISDIVMPELDGYGLCREMKADPELAHVPLLLVTTLSDPEDVLRGLEAGADSFILKPYDDPFLLSRIRFVLLQRQLRQTDRADMGVEISFNGRSHFITSDRLQIFNLLLSTYEAAIQRSDELRRSEEELRRANDALTQANAKLQEEVRHRQLAEVQVRKLSQDLLRSSEAQLQQSQERYQQLLDVVPAAIYATDAAGRILEYNQAAIALWGVQPDPGTRSRDFYRNFDLRRPDGAPVSEGDCPMGATLVDGSPVRNAGVVMRRADGSHVEALVNSAVLRTKEGEMAGVINCLLDVTELGKAQLELVASQQLAQATLDALSPRICVFDEAGAIVAINAAWREFWRSRDAAHAGPAKDASEFLADLRSLGCGDDEIACIEAGLREVATGHREQFHSECGGKLPRRWLSVKGKRFVFGNTTRTVVLQEDISEQKETEARRREDQALRRIAGEMARIGGWACDVAEGRVVLTDQTAAIYELPLGTTLGLEEALGYYVPESRERIRSQFTACAEGGPPIDTEAELVTAKGQRLWVRVLAEAFADSSGAITRLQGAIQDVSARKQQDAQLERTAVQMVTTLESITDAFWAVDRDWCFTYVNKEAVRLLQMSREAMLGRCVWDLFADALGTEFEHQYRRAVATGVVSRFETFYPRLNRWLEVHAYPNEEGLAVYFRDISERKQADLALQKSEENLRLAVTAAGMGIWHWNSRVGYVHISDEAKAMFGIPPDAAVTEHDVVDAMHPEDRHDALAMLKTSTAQGDGFRKDFRVLSPDGSVRWIASLGRAYPDEELGGTRVQGVNLDITDRKRSERELLELNEQLEQRVEQRTFELAEATRQAEAANQAKSAFLATMSHEIRTPMNGIVGMVDVLAHGGLAAHQSDAVHTIRQSALTLLQLIDDVLDFSKIEAGKLELERTEVSLLDIAEGVCDTLGPIASSRDVDIFLFVTPEGPGRVWSDPVRLRQILYNLVGNAIKFSGGRRGRRGRVDLRVELAGQQPPRFRLRVTDNGIGMSAEVQSNLFESFRQAEASTTRRFGGTGLGLAICRRIVKLMAGEISVESSEGKGAMFTVELPLEAVDEPPLTHVRDLVGVDYVLVAGPHIKAGDLQVHLEWAGARTQVVASGQEARDACDMLPGAVVVHGLAEMGDQAEWLASFDHLPHVRHLLISRGRRRAARMVASNAVSIDGNSARSQALLHAAAIAAGRAVAESHTNGGRSVHSSDPVAVPSLTEARESGRLILVAEDDRTNQKVLLRQLELLGYAAEVASDGAEALSLWRKGGYSLLLTDLHMPELDGYDLAAAVRQEEPEGKRMPILALTANAVSGVDGRARAAGVDQYLTKPMQLEMLRNVLERWLPGASDGAALQPEKSGPPCRDGKQLLNILVLKQLVGDVPEVLEDMLAEYRWSLEQALPSMLEAEASGDLDALGMLAHRLKSSSRAVGALALGDLCAELENASRVADKEATTRLLERFGCMVGKLLSEIALQCTPDPAQER